ncbi:MAG: hypothetical protein LBI78_07090 [Campylobacteraceae bacterium]|jgi:hypothetical protein|nr:hypothetical protein [Campylobacteraceae bacterium]
MFAFKSNKVLTKILFAAFISLLFIGCGGNSNNEKSSPVSSIYHIVSFYDKDLDLVRTQSVTDEAVINLAVIDSGVWYKAGESTALESYTINESISFYETAGVIEIADQSGLNGIRSNLSGHFILTDDIVLIDSDGFDAQGWLSIGDYNTPFEGILNGNKHTISGLWMNRTASNNEYDGLFGGIANGMVKNLGIETNDDGIQGYNYVGIIAGIITNSTIINSYTDGSVSGRNNVGGIVGFVYNDAKIVSSYSSANVYGAFDGVGGIAGTIQGAPMGISEGSASITDSYTTGDITGAASWVGGIVGNAQRWAVINNCYAKGNISGVSSVGGIAGRVYHSSNITNNVAINNLVFGMSSIGAIVGESGFIGAVNNNTIKNNFALDTMDVVGSLTSGSMGSPKTEINLQTQQTYSDDIDGDGLGGLGWSFGDNDTDFWQMGNYPNLHWE